MVVVVWWLWLGKGNEWKERERREDQIWLDTLKGWGREGECVVAMVEEEKMPFGQNLWGTASEPFNMRQI